ncbi:hypothetical protein INS49_009363 [Diaporthe citri]|uniref:uncharacterized protein n=1 Tax=Diaporthe citri TaxID=83186 RepID=UPI001C815982|nr:uncharacterized protein INS49_009363 [Diaporthe citri]KAG6361139.1 hypothetical protein INS49_009363 [Diaporthe citri]
MLSIQSVEGPSPPRADDTGDMKQQKPKTLPCKYCNKWFRDLLVRHEKLVHLSDGNKDANGVSTQRRKSSAAGTQSSPTKSHGDTEMLGMQQTPTQTHFAPEAAMSAVVSSLPPDSRIAPRPAAACNLDLLSDAATHLASAGDVSSMQNMLPDMSQQQTPLGRVDGLPSYGDRSREQDPVVYSTPFPVTTAPYSVSSAPFPITSAPFPVTSATFPVTSNAQPNFEGYDLFMDDFGTQSHFLPAGVDTEQSFGGWRAGTSSFPSRFPSLAPEASTDGTGRLQDEVMRAPLWRISSNDHGVIKSRLDEFSSVLPNDFVFPSRHTLTRYLEGYISGFQEHLPFLHIPTLNPSEIAPELLLAIASVGAQYRFESHRGHALWYAAKAVALEQIRRRHSHEVHTLLPTPAAYSPHSTRASPSSGFRHSFNSVHSDRPMTQETHREPYSPNNPQSRLETIQALLLLFSVGLWGAKAILQDALSLQSQLALLIRDEGLNSNSTQIADWETWVRNEGSNRTKLIAYCYFNLCSVAYNSPPVLFTSEMNLYLPGPARLWRAESSWAWRDARQSVQYMELPLQEALSRLLHRPSQGPLNDLTSLGNYVLIHALIQHIYLLKQTSFANTSRYDMHRGLKAEDVEEVTQALRVWQLGFEEHRMRITQSAQQMGSENFPGGPVSFDATALSRLAHIRLHTDLAPARALESREPYAAANIFNGLALLPRGPRLNKAILQAVHALSMLVKAGINYIARTKSLEWSMQHSFLLAKWLMTMASMSATEMQTAEEKSILASIRTIVDETEYAVPIDPSLAAQQPSRMDGSLNDSQKLRQLASAVLRIWAKTFKGEHIFELVKTMGHGLEIYSNTLDKPRDQPSLGRMSSGSILE